MRIYGAATFGIFPPEANVLRLLDQDDIDIDDAYDHKWWQTMMMTMLDDNNDKW